MSRKERVVAAIRLLIAAAGAVRRLPPAVNSLRWGLPAERLSRVAAQARRGLAERVLAGVLLAVAVTGAVLIPQLLVGPSPQHELGVGAPSVTGPPVVLAPGLPAQKSQPQAAAGLQSHATHVGVVTSASTSSQPAAQELPVTSPAARRPPGAQPRPQPQPEAQSTIHALTPVALAPGAPTCNGTYSDTGKDVVVPSGATCPDRGNRAGHDLVVVGNANAVARAGNSVRHDLRIDGAAPTRHAPPPPHPVRTPKPPKPQHEPKPPAPPKAQDKPKPHSVPEPKEHADHAKPAHVPPPPQPHPDHPKSAHVPPPPKPHPDHPQHPDHAKSQHTPPPEPSQEAEPHGHGNGHKQ
jgi:hypothetical protein